MKSYGVRIAAGAITLLFGACAAVMAHKDKQDESTTWTAEMPDLGEPAQPIAADSWTTEPPKPKSATPLEMGAIQLMQHTEPIKNEQSEPSGGPSFDPSMLPATLTDNRESDSPEMVIPDWTLDAEEPAPAATNANPAPTPAFSMSFPTDGTAAEAAAPPADVGQSPMSFGQMPSMPDPTDHADDATAAVAAATVVGSGAALDFAVSQTNDRVADQNDAPAFPSNSLRGPTSGEIETPPAATNHSTAAEADGFAFDGQSFQYDAPAAEPAQPGFTPPSSSGLAQDAPGFGQSAQQFDQPTEMTDVPSAGLGAPQPGGFNQPGDYAQPGDTATFNNVQQFNDASQPEATPPPRMASLSNTNLPGFDAGPQGFEAGTQPQAMAQPGRAVAIDDPTIIDKPGDRRLEGAQTPSIVIQKQAPAEVKVGKPATFVIHVQNVGAAEALAVKIHDRIPAGMSLADASPTPTQQGNLLFWELGAMPAGDQRTVTMQLVPEQEGELGSVARVSFEAAASVRTISTRPELKIVQHAPETVLIGQQLEIELEVSNPGSGEATGVMLLEDVPEGLEHPKGRRLDNSLGNLAPGEARRQVLRLRAVAPGLVQNTIRLQGDDGLQADHTIAVQVIAPELQVELSGPSRRFLERQATYELNIANAGTADATNVEIAVQLDRGFTFVSTDYQGQYDPTRHAVYWSLAQLPAGANGKVPLTLLPVEEGEQAIVIDARADLGVVAKSERKMTVEGFAQLNFAIRSEGGPIEVGSETVYEITVKNAGSKPDSNVRVQLQLPEGLKLISADSKAGTNGRGLVVFEPLAQLAPGSEQVYRIRLQGAAQGTQVVRAVVVSDQSTVPVNKEGSTLVYADQ